MSSTHRRLMAGRLALRSLLVVGARGAATLPAGAMAGDLPGIGGVMIAGPQGSRTGTDVPDPATPPEAATIAPFDTYGRDPALRLWFAGNEEDGDGWVSWEVTATPATDPSAAPLTLAAGVAEVPVASVDLTAPAPGDWLVLATTVAGTAGPEGTWAWHLVVPDRTLPAQLQAPDLVLFGGGGTVVAERGSGCYLGSCGDIGAVPPARTLPLITLERADEPIALTLSDGSGIGTVTVQAQLLNVEESAPVTLLDGVDVAGTNVVMVPPPPSAGRWRLDVFVQFSDGRGDQAGYARVAVPQP